MLCGWRDCTHICMQESDLQKLLLYKVDIIALVVHTLKSNLESTVNFMEIKKKVYHFEYACIPMSCTNFSNEDYYY